MSSAPQCAQPDPERFHCWCGESGPFEEMCSNDLDAGCGGTGSLNCYCGGDLCVCHNHGRVECPGCEDCSYDPETDFGGFDSYDEHL